jgi:starch synthase
VRILYAASEVAPFAKTGGLGDVSAALPLALHARGHQVLLVAPLYRRIARSGVTLEPVPTERPMVFRLGPHTVHFTLYRTRLPGSSLSVYFVHQPTLYDRDGIYTEDDDEHLRFSALTHAALVACQHLGFSPDIAHVHDWQTALLPLVLHARFAWDRLRFARTRTVLTIHNLAHQGVFEARVVPETGLGASAHLFHREQLEGGVLNYLLTGILYADAVTTVSPTYAREIQTPELGMGLDPFLRARSSTVVGILNGIDAEDWNPRLDPHLAHPYGADGLEAKEENKKALLRRFDLPYVEGVPLLGVVSRLAHQKGLELILQAMPGFLAANRCQLVVLGSGARAYEEGFVALKRRFPRHVGFYRGFSNPLAHQIEAGADSFLMPSRFEPCGLNQLYSLAYGTPPVVRRTGGLADSVTQFDRETGKGTGVLFDDFDARGLTWGIDRVLRLYEDRPSWRRLQANGMAEDHSWSQRVRLYETLYRRVLSRP